MAQKERIIYNNYDLADYYDEVKADLEQHYVDEGDGRAATDEEIWDEIYFLNSITWEEEKLIMESFFQKRTFVLRGTSGLWIGNRDAGAIIRNFGELPKAWKDCDYLKIYDVDGHFLIQSSHHDGTNHYELRELNQRGLDYLERHENYMADRELHEKLWKPQYSRLPRYAQKIFGCPCRETA